MKKLLSRHNIFSALVLALLSSLFVSEVYANTADSKTDSKLVIAHRGASAYVPEHTLESKVLAYMMGADYVEQDVVMSKDNHLIVIHDLYLDELSNVASVFPERKRKDGHYYVIDFTLQELKSLQFSEPFTTKNGKKVQTYPDRFPMQTSTFTLHTLEEEIEFIQGLNKTLGKKMGKEVGIYVETKAPWFHKQEGKDISLATLEVLKKYGYTTKDSKVYFQSFDYPDLVRVKKELLKKLKMDIKLVALVGYNNWLETYELKNNKWIPYDFTYLQDSKNFKDIAKVVDGVGPTITMLFNIQDNKAVENGYAKLAAKAGLAVHPYTLRADSLPAYVKSADDLINLVLFEAGASGIFTDFPDLVVEFLDKNTK